MSDREPTVLQLVKRAESDEVTLIGQALLELIESFDIEVLIEDGETPRSYFINPRKGILRHGNAATLDAANQLGVTLLGRMLSDLGGTALMHRVRDQVVAQYVAAQSGDDDIDVNKHRRWLMYIFKVCWKGIDARADRS